MTYKQIMQEKNISLYKAKIYIKKNNIKIQYAEKPHWDFEEEKIQIAKQYGFNHPDELIKNLYPEKSSNEIGKILEIAGCSVLRHIHRLKLKPRPKGGNQYKKKK